MQPSRQRLMTRLRAARRTHCNTCGCSRCKRIDQLLADADQSLGGHPEDSGRWLIEGKLVNDGDGKWSIQVGDQNIALHECLFPWDGFRIVILIES